MRSETEDPAEGFDDGGEPGPEDEVGEKSGKSGSFWKEMPVLIGVAVILALVIKTWVVQAFYIPSASMENTLQIGDRVLVNKIVYHLRPIERGDVVVFNGLDSWDPEVSVAEPGNPVMRGLRAIGGAFGLVAGEKDYIKRVIGVPGDHVVCCDAQTGRVTVNGVALDETSYLYKDPATGKQNVPSSDKFDVVVPPKRLWVMGDHRAVSWDSRGHQADAGGGTIPVGSVVGRAFVVVWPISDWQILDIPKTFQQKGLSLPSGPDAPAVAAEPLLALPRRPVG